MESSDSREAGVGQLVRSLRRRRGWTAQRLAEECARAGMPSLTRGTLAKIESGVRKSVTADEIVALARALGVAAEDLLPGRPGADARRVNERDAPCPAERHGLIFIAIGGPVNQLKPEHPAMSLPPGDSALLGEYVKPGHVEVSELRGLIEDIRDRAHSWAEDPRFSILHLFYRGPVVIAPMLGRLLASKPLVVYHFEGGRYLPVYMIDKQFLYPPPEQLGGSAS